MIAYVDIEHPRFLESPDARAWHWEKIMRHVSLFEEVFEGMCCLLRPPRFSAAAVRGFPFSAVVISGNCADWSEYPHGWFDEIKRLLVAGDLPVLGICGGHQLIAVLLGGQAGPMRQLYSGETDPMPEFHPGMYKERGFVPVSVVRPHSLFADCPNPIEVYESHYWEVTRLPPEFEPLASSSACAVQAMAHSELPIFGAQFHPEEATDEHPDGRRVLRNFFRLCANAE